MNTLKSICVFCGSSEGNDPAILEQAKVLGNQLAANNITLVYGGSQLGIMGAVAKASLNQGGKAIGIIPEFLKTKEIVFKELDEVITTQNMHIKNARSKRWFYNASGWFRYV